MYNSGVELQIEIILKSKAQVICHQTLRSNALCYIAAHCFYLMGAISFLFDFLFIFQNSWKVILLSNWNYVYTAKPDGLIFV